MSSNTFRISIDSRQRLPGSTPYDAHFRLQRTIGPVRSVRLVHATFVNHLFNVRKTQNWIMASSDGGSTFSQQFICPIGYYTYEGFVTAVNTWATSFIGSNCLVPSTGPQVEWDMPATLVLSDGPMRDILGLYRDSSNPVTGLKTNIFLSIPLHVGMYCPSLVSGHRHLSCDAGSTETPLLCMIPVQSGYGTNNLYLPTTSYTVECQTRQIDTMQFILLDSYDNTVMTDIQQWSAELEVELYQI